MISRKDVERLAAFRSDDGVVSAYVRIDPKLVYDRQAHAAQFKGAVRAFLRANKNGAWQAVLERESGRILRFLEERLPSGRGLAIFACQPAGLWEALTLQVPVPSFIDVGPSPSIEVLARILDEYPRFAVVVVQRDAARIYLSEQRQADAGAVVEVTSDVPGWHDQGGWAQARFQRHIEVHVQRHLREVADELERLFYERPFSRLTVGGSPEAVDEFLALLPEPVARCVVGTFPVDLKHDSEEAVLERARQVGDEAERRSEAELVTRALEAAASGGRGAAGLDETLRAVAEARVHTLLVADGLVREGAVCPACGHLAAEPVPRCPLCGAEAEAVSDVIERAVERAFLAGAHIETVLGPARQRLLENGGLAAILRY